MFVDTGIDEFVALYKDVPDIIVDFNRNDGTLILEHVYDGRELELLYAKETIKYLFDLWGHKIVLKTKTKEGSQI